MSELIIMFVLLALGLLRALDHQQRATLVAGVRPANQNQKIKIACCMHANLATVRT